MVIFWVLVVVMVVCSLLVIVRRLLTMSDMQPGTDPDPLPVVFTQRLQELEQEFNDGLITDDQLQQARLEMQHTLLKETGADVSTPATRTRDPRRDWKSAGTLLVLLPLTAAGMYYYLGSPGIIRSLQLTSQITADSSREQQIATIAEMVDSLAERMQDNPDDIEGWTMLARSYKVLHRYAEAASAFEHVYTLEPGNVDVILQYADSLAMQNNGRLAGRPELLIHQALEQAPDNPMALWLAGMAAAEQGDRAVALEHWQRLLPLVNSDAEAYQQVRQMIASLQPGDSTGQPDITAAQQPAADTSSVQVRVQLSNGLKDQVQAGDTLYIYARAVSGPPMPLAAARYTVADLPLAITLDDSMAMMPEMKISAFDEVTVSARISRSGNPTAASGDLEAAAQRATPGQEGVVVLTIDSIIP